MSLTATVVAKADASLDQTSGLTRSCSAHSFDFSVSVGDCTRVFSDRRTFPSVGYDEIDFDSIGVSTVKLVFVRNLSATHQMALTAGWTGSQFNAFRQDVTSWNFSPMINLGSLTMRGYPIRESGCFMLSCPNTAGFATTGGGSILRIGGTSGQQYEIYVMGV